MVFEAQLQLHLTFAAAYMYQPPVPTSSHRRSAAEGLAAATWRPAGTSRPAARRHASDRTGRLVYEKRINLQTISYIFNVLLRDGTVLPGQPYIFCPIWWSGGNYIFFFSIHIVYVVSRCCVCVCVCEIGRAHV